MGIMTVKCPKCGVTKPYSEFHKEKVRKRGIDCYCKDCRNEIGRKRDRLPRRLEKTKRYYATERGKEVQRTNARARYNKDKRKKLAIVLVGKAIKEGVLTRQLCETCGVDNTHGHHNNYDKPLEVHWLCPQHHWDFHRSIKIPTTL